jgi:hypothetical protein
MTEPAIVAMSTDDAVNGGLLRLAEAGSTTVWPCCDDYLSFLRLRDVLPPWAKQVAMNPVLNDLAEEMSGTVQNIADHLKTADLPDRIWQASDLSDRGPYASRLQLNLARRVAVARAAQQDGGRHLVVANDAAQARAIAGSDKPESLFRKLVFAGPRLKGGLQMARRIAACKELQATFDSRLSALRQADVVLVTWCGPETFASADPKDSSTTLGSLVRILSDSGLKLGFLGLPLYWQHPMVEIVRNLAQPGLPAVLATELFSVGDVPRYVASGAGLADSLSLPFEYDGVDCSGVVRYEARKAAASFRIPEAAMLHDVPRRLADLQVLPHKVMYAYEYQPWEKALLLGARQAWPDATACAVQIAPFAENSLGFFPGRHDSACMPDHLVAMGPEFRDIFVRRGFPAERLSVGGAIRFESAVKQSTSPIKRNGALAASILCSLSIELGESIELAIKAAVATRAAKCRMIVNFHPITDENWRQQLRAAVASGTTGESNHIVYSPDRIGALIEQVDAVIYNTSGSAIDAVTHGVPVIYMARETEIDFDKLPQGTHARCATVEQLTALLETPVAEWGTQATPESLRGRLGPVDKSVFVDAACGRRPLKSSMNEDWGNTAR